MVNDLLLHRREAKSYEELFRKNLTGGRFRPEQVAGLNRNGWQLSPEWVAGFSRNTHSVRECFVAIRERATQIENTLILIDAFGLSAPKREFDRFLVGEAIAELLPQPMKVAALSRAELINKFAENTAVNRGARFLVCSNEDEALQWLLEESAQ